MMQSQDLMGLSALDDGVQEANKLKRIANEIPRVPFRDVPNFYDIGPILAKPAELDGLMALMSRRIHFSHATHVAGVDARGFIFGPLLANALYMPFLMIRKAGKLPNAVYSNSYTKEYSKLDETDGAEDQLCVQRGSIGPNDRVVIVDDVVATGGTLLAASDLVERMGAKVECCLCVAEISELGARAKLESVGVDLFVAVPESAWE